MKGDVPPWLRKILLAQEGGCGQAVVIAGEGFLARALTLERRGQTWSFVFKPILAVAGRAGFAAFGEKREGDGRTPSGVFPFEQAFGYAEAIDSAMPYCRIDEDDVWVNDPASPLYNTWAKKAMAGPFSFEEMRREDGLYRVGIIIGYNRHPVKKGLGSAIFVHPWRARGAATSGCVAMAERDLRLILSWLHPEKLPVAILEGEAKTNEGHQMS